MNLTNFLLIIMWGLVAPFILGYELDLMTSKDKISYSKCLLFGYVVYFAVFQLLAPFFIIKKSGFNTLYISWLSVIAIAMVCVLVINRKSLIKRITEPIRMIRMTIKESKTSLIKYVIDNHDWLEILLFLGAGFIIVIHTLLIGYMMHFDTDDARFVAEALEAYEKNTMLLYHPITGEFLGGPIGEMRKDIFCTYPFFIAVFGKLFRLTPAIASHSVLPFLFVPMCYMSFGNIAKYVFKNDCKKVVMATFLFGVINTFSMETVFSFGWVLLTIIWQGRSILCTVYIPFVLYMLMKIVDEEDACNSLYLALSLTGIACSMLSGMGGILVVLMVFSYVFIVLVVKRSIKDSIRLVTALIPTLIYFLLNATSLGW